MNGYGLSSWQRAQERRGERGGVIIIAISYCYANCICKNKSSIDISNSAILTSFISSNERMKTATCTITNTANIHVTCVVQCTVELRYMAESVSSVSRGGVFMKSPHISN